MPLLVWSLDLARMGGINRRATRMRSVDVNVDVENGFPNPWLRYNAHFWYEKVEVLLLTVSPTYALLTPSAAIYVPFTPSVATYAISLNYMFEQALYAYALLTDEGYLGIEESESLGRMAQPRLFPQLLL